MVIMEDNPNFWDAWDVDQFHLEKQTHLKFGNVRVLEGGPVRATIGASLRVGQSSMEVEVRRGLTGNHPHDRSTLIIPRSRLTPCPHR
jgi:alpha-mannosidase